MRANFLEDSLQLYEKQTAITDSDDTTPLEIDHGIVELENVHFRVLQGISFTSEPGQTVGCVGRNGAGKTTMLQLLCGLYSPSSGSVKIDGQNLTKVTTESLRERIYLSTQSCPKFGKTVRENLEYCAPQTTAEQIDEAATEVGLIDMMDVNDKKLSSGELQKLAIARTLVRNPTILLLDEPMSAVDNIALQSIRQMLTKVTSGRTTFIVAHQLRTVQHADIILVFEKGQIVQQGTHEKLVESDGLYRQLWVAEHGSA
jgi:ABC-type multidrug transport system fused ATPase/permease subunit